MKKLINFVAGFCSIVILGGVLTIGLSLSSCSNRTTMPVAPSVNQDFRAKDVPPDAVTICGGYVVSASCSLESMCPPVANSGCTIYAIIPTDTDTPTITPTFTPIPSVTPSSSVTQSLSQTPATNTPTVPLTDTPTFTDTPTPVPTDTFTPTIPPTPTFSPTPDLQATATKTAQRKACFKNCAEEGVITTGRDTVACVILFETPPAYITCLGLAVINGMGDYAFCVASDNCFGDPSEAEIKAIVERAHDIPRGVREKAGRFISKNGELNKKSDLSEITSRIDLLFSLIDPSELLTNPTKALLNALKTAKETLKENSSPGDDDGADDEGNFDEQNK